MIIDQCDLLLEEHANSNDSNAINNQFIELFAKQDCSNWIILKLIQRTVTNGYSKSWNFILKSLYIPLYSDQLYYKIQEIHHQYSPDLVELMIGSCTNCSDPVFQKIKKQYNLYNKYPSVLLRDIRISAAELKSMYVIETTKFYIPRKSDYRYLSNLIYNPNLPLYDLKEILKKYRYELSVNVLEFIICHPHCSFEWVCDEIDSHPYKDLSSQTPKTVQTLIEYVKTLTELQKITLGKKIPMLYKMGLAINTLNASIEILGQGTNEK